jgi:hypothetical protein
MHAVESLILPLEDMHSKNIGKLRKSFEETAGGLRHSSDIMRYIEPYSARTLTYPSDRLNAIQGVLQHFSHVSKNAFYHLAGIPIYRKKDVKMAFLHGLSWRLNDSGIRRPEFPSWSWMGWDGKLSHSLELEERNTASEVEIVLEEEDGTLHELPSFEDMPSLTARIGNTLKFINLDTWTIVASFVEFRRSSFGRPTDLGCGAILRLNASLLIEVFIRPCEARRSFDAFKNWALNAPLIMVALQDNDVAFRTLLFLLVENKGHYVERVGDVNICSWNFAYRDNSGTKSLPVTQSQIFANMTRQRVRIG